MTAGYILTVIFLASTIGTVYLCGLLFVKSFTYTANFLDGFSSKARRLMAAVFSIPAKMVGLTKTFFAKYAKKENPDVAGHAESDLSDNSLNQSAQIGFLEQHLLQQDYDRKADEPAWVRYNVAV